MSETTIQVLKNGPLVVKGPVKIMSAEGKPIEATGEATALCRCGLSGAKPFCDGAHRKANFQG